MSSEDSVGFTIAEKFFALLIILIGIIVFYITATSPNLMFPIFFTAGGLALVVLGVFMVLARAK
ncbi:MAG: hypothetical protein JSW72_05930 [Candidatus Bathyarchaeota archaeon]|nr:MAG: hypothetical protein JSW72_05930 [Candidatus Bathyarchaeota archaeon]